jgi:TnpA family transposase
MRTRLSYSWSPIIEQWDALARIAVSMKSGWSAAALTLECLGAAAQGNPTYDATVALGKLLRTIYLSDYLSCATFRTDILTLLNQGESLHGLQRAIYHGSITAKQILGQSFRVWPLKY